MRELTERVHEHPLRRAWIPMEWRTSWWIPVASPETGRLYLACFFYPVEQLRGQPARVGRPQLHATIDPVAGEFVEVTDCRFRDFASHLPPDPVLGTLPLPGAPVLSAEQWSQVQQELYEAYDRLLPLAFRGTDQLTEEQRGAAAYFRKRLEAVMEPFLRSYFEALNPAFFEWLRQVV